MSRDEYKVLEDAFAILKRLRRATKDAGGDEYGIEMVGDAIDALGAVLFEMEGNCE